MSDIFGKGYGDVHLWKRGQTYQVGGGHFHKRGTEYKCKKCGIEFVHRYALIPNIFEAMIQSRVSASCDPNMIETIATAATATIVSTMPAMVDVSTSSSTLVISATSTTSSASTSSSTLAVSATSTTSISSSSSSSTMTDTATGQRVIDSERKESGQRKESGPPSMASSLAPSPKTVAVTVPILPGTTTKSGGSIDRVIVPSTTTNEEMQQLADAFTKTCGLSVTVVRQT